MYTITIIGTGYVGTTTAAILSNAGYKVYALDVNKEKIETLKKGKSFFYEKGLDEFVSEGVNKGNLIPTTSYSEAIPNSQVVFSCVGTPDNKDGSMNLEFVYKAAKETAKLAVGELIYVQKSTVPVGTGREVLDIMHESNPSLRVSYVSNPEFLREGVAIYDSFTPDRVIIGSDEGNAIKLIENIYNDIYKLGKKLELSKYIDFASSNSVNNKQVNLKKLNILSTSIESAELIKVSANAFLALKISYANTLAKLSDRVGANIKEVMDGIGLDKRIGRSFLYPGLGWGGGCFPKDVDGLISSMNKNGVDSVILDAAVKVNSSMANYVTKKINDVNSQNSNKVKKIGVLGLAFKAGTSDSRKSPAVKLCNSLINQGFEVYTYDPKASDEAKEDLKQEVEVSKDLEGIFNMDIDLFVIATEWPEFKNIDWSKAKISTNTIVDGRNILDKEMLKSLGINYYGVGL